MTRAPWPTPTTPEEEVELGTAVLTGGLVARPARDRLTTSHLGLAMGRAMKLAPRVGLDVDDAYGAGMLGLIAAAEKFDPAKGCRFATYARWWVDQAISRHAAKAAGSAAVPVSHVTNPGRDPGRSAQAAAIRRPFLRLDEPLPNGQSRHETVAAPDRAGPDAEEVRAVRAALDRLGARERAAIERHYGIRGPAEPDAEIALALGVCPRSLTTIRMRAIRRLRAEMGVATP